MANNLRMSMSGDGLLDPAKLTAWTREQQQRINRGVAKGMRIAGKPLAEKANAQARSALKVKRSNFPNIRAKVYDTDKNKLPAMRIYSNIPWLGAHMSGATIRGQGNKLLIPLVRTGYKAFRNILDQLRRVGEGFFKEVRGKVYLFAEYQPEYFQGKLRQFMRPLRGGYKFGRIKRGADVPIALLVPQVTLKRRIHMDRIVRSGLPDIARAIEREI